MDMIIEKEEILKWTENSNVMSLVSFKPCLDSRL